MKANGQSAPPPVEVEAVTEPARDLFGNPLPEEPPAKKPTVAIAPLPSPKASPVAVEPAAESDAPLVRNLTDEDIASFKALGVEVCIASEELGEVWLVPEYTGRERKEITPEHAATIARVMEAFPGSKVVSFEKSPQQGKEAE